MSMTKGEYEKWLETHPADEPDECEQLEASAMHALHCAALDLVAVGWTAHDLTNAVAEAIAPPAAPIDMASSDEPIPY